MKIITHNIRTKILQTSELQRETISENNLIYKLMIWKKTFKVIRTLLDKDAGINVCKTVDFIIDNRLVRDYNVISNKFNDYFVSIGSISGAARGQGGGHLPPGAARRGAPKSCQIIFKNLCKEKFKKF